MARYHVNQFSAFPYHITDRSPNRAPFKGNLLDVWKVMEDYLYLAHHKHNLKIHSFVLMPNHFHMVASISEFSIGAAMCDFLRDSSKAINQLTHKINQTWGGRHYKCELIHNYHFFNTYKYVYQNPVRAGLCDHVEGWRFSTLSGLLGFTQLAIPLEPDSILFSDDNHFADPSVLQWLNTPIKKNDYLDIKKALRKKAFSLPKRKEIPHPLNTKLI